MSNKTVKDFSDKVVATVIENAFVTAFGYFEPGFYNLFYPTKADPRWLKLYEDQGFDHRLKEVSSIGGLTYTYKQEVAFYMSISVEVFVGWDRREGLIVRCRPSWASFSGSTLEGIAAAKLHLEVAERCATAECAMREAFRKLKGNSDEDATRWGEGCERFFDRIRSVRDAVQAEWKTICEADAAKVVEYSV